VSDLLLGTDDIGLLASNDHENRAITVGLRLNLGLGGGGNVLEDARVVLDLGIQLSLQDRLAQEKTKGGQPSHTLGRTTRMLVSILILGAELAGEDFFEPALDEADEAGGVLGLLTIAGYKSAR